MVRGTWSKEATGVRETGEPSRDNGQTWAPGSIFIFAAPENSTVDAVRKRPTLGEDQRQHCFLIALPALSQT
jgi:hypothetical protein